MPNKLYNVLFLCTGNSARGIFAEAIMNHWGQGKAKAYSAGSHPAGQVQPMTLELLTRFNLPTEGLRSKSWDEFTTQQSPKIDFVFTVCDKAAKETCPVWPGQPITAHWGVADPVEEQGDDVDRMLAYRNAFRELENRIKIFLNLPFESLSQLRLQRELDRIGRISLIPPVADVVA